MTIPERLKINSSSDRVHVTDDAAAACRGFFVDESSSQQRRLKNEELLLVHRPCFNSDSKRSTRQEGSLLLLASLKKQSIAIFLLALLVVQLPQHHLFSSSPGVAVTAFGFSTRKRTTSRGRTTTAFQCFQRQGATTATSISFRTKTNNIVPKRSRTMGIAASSSPSDVKSSSSSTNLPRMESSDVSSGGGGTSSGGSAAVLQKEEGGTIKESGAQEVVGADNPIIVHSFHEEPKSIQNLIQEAKSLFDSTFTSTTPKKSCSVAPGRVNLIGEHVDYTGGFVLPLAIEYSTACYGIGTLSTTGTPDRKMVRLNLVSTMDPSNVASLELDVDLNNKQMPLKASSEKQLRWTNYITGVVAQYVEILFNDTTNNNVLDMTLAFCSNVPLGGGLSSSASLEVAVALWLENHFGLAKPMSYYQVNPVDRALKCQTAEHVYANTPCGIMDQYIISAGQTNSLLKIDCETNTFELVTMPSSSADEICFVVTNSQVKHDNAGGEYPIRVQQCKEVKALIEQAIGHTVPNLRHVTMDMLQRTLDQQLFPNGKEDVLYKRAHHVITENERVLKCQTALEEGDWTTVGQLMTQSHRSMQYDYETSCDEIDFLVDAALAFNNNHEQTAPVYGTRLTGGGFGGCTVSLIKKEYADQFIDYLKTRYKESKFEQHDCVSFITTPACGVRIVDVSTLNNN